MGWNGSFGSGNFYDTFKTDYAAYAAVKLWYYILFLLAKIKNGRRIN